MDKDRQDVKFLELLCFMMQHHVIKLLTLIFCILLFFFSGLTFLNPWYATKDSTTRHLFTSVSGIIIIILLLPLNIIITSNQASHEDEWIASIPGIPKIYAAQSSASVPNPTVTCKPRCDKLNTITRRGMVLSGDVCFWAAMP